MSKFDSHIWSFLKTINKPHYENFPKIGFVSWELVISLFSFKNDREAYEITRLFVRLFVCVSLLTTSEPAGIFLRHSVGRSSH